MNNYILTPKLIYWRMHHRASEKDLDKKKFIDEYPIFTDEYLYILTESVIGP